MKSQRHNLHAIIDTGGQESARVFRHPAELGYGKSFRDGIGHRWLCPEANHLFAAGAGARPVHGRSPAEADLAPAMKEDGPGGESMNALTSGETSF